VRVSDLIAKNKIKVSILSLAALASASLVFASGSTSIANSLPATSPTTKPMAAMATQSAPLWATLTAQQKLALAPLSGEWDKMDATRKKKWLEIANKYPSMKPDEQVRVQERIRDWVKLSPEQRMQVRENFAKTTKINPEQKSAQWQQYQQLSEEQKKQLASEAGTKKSITNLPPESQRNIQPLAPIRVGPPVPKPSPKPVPAPKPVAEAIPPVDPAQLAPLTPPVAPIINTTASQAAVK
jgi:hypothetical protein